MIQYSQAMLSSGGAKTGIAPANLLDVQTVSGQIYYWADRAITTAAGITADGSPANATYLPWLLSVPEIKLYRSLQTDTGAFVVQNISGDSLARDIEKLVRASTLEGAIFVYRMWQPDAEGAWIEVHGNLTVDEIEDTEASLNGSQLLDVSQSDTPLEVFSETCQLDWASKRCGATGTTECLYSFQTCQVVERIMVIMNNYEKNYGQADANVATTTFNRRRQI